MDSQDVNIKKEALKALNQFKEVRAAVQLLYNGKRVSCVVIGTTEDLENVIANSCLQQPRIKAFLANGLGLALENEERLKESYDEMPS